MDNLIKLMDFLDRLEKAKIYYKLDKNIGSNGRDCVRVEIAIPDERWEVEFVEDGSIDVEKFITTTEILGEEELEKLFEKFSE